MPDLTIYSNTALEAELKKREREAKTKIPLALVKQPDFTALQVAVTDSVAQIVKDGYENDDSIHYIHEAAMETFYGKEYWAWKKKATQ